MKKVTQVLRFLTLVFFMLLAMAVCFVFNKVLDQKIEQQHAQAIESIEDFNQTPPEE